MLNHIKIRKYVLKFKSNFWDHPYKIAIGRHLRLRGMKNRSTMYLYKISSKSVQPLRRIMVTNTVTRFFYIYKLDVRVLVRLDRISVSPPYQFLPQFNAIRCLSLQGKFIHDAQPHTDSNVLFIYLVMTRSGTSVQIK